MNNASKYNKNQCDQLIELVLAENCLFFHDQFEETYVQLPITYNRRVYKLNSSGFKGWLTKLFYEKKNKTINKNIISSAIGLLEAKASHDGAKINLENRVANFENAIWYDLTDNDSKAIKVTASGWGIEDAPLIFKKYAHQSPQVTPDNSGTVKDILKFVNLSNKDLEILLLVYLVSCFIPDIPHPILIVHGSQGAAKTTFAKVLKTLIDPSKLKVLSLLNNDKDLIQQLSHHWFLFYDNLNMLPDYISDIFCRTVTGEGFTKRVLYSNDEDYFYQFRRCIAANGISLVARKPDLLDRSVLFELDRISPEKRITEDMFWKEFEAKRPLILGGIFNVLSEAMRIKDSIQLEKIPRMADFAVWGEAIAIALGFEPGEFTKAYTKNIEEQHDEILGENPIATTVIELLKIEEKYVGTATSLMPKLEAIANTLDINIRSSHWPKAGNALSRKIFEIKVNLAEKGVNVFKSRDSEGNKVINLERIFLEANQVEIEFNENPVEEP